ncbi:MAG: Rrf2 family transcriptional regulator [Clostridia bacterium]|jgi:Rrf2 family protein|nr:transcriptional regulator Rrf2 family [Clostridium sp. CAG:571]HJJ07252.1 Rrf2 family transcriptional regulator [Clostridiaceae bacterium]HJJ14793.1 Rrf2 family transcriptional regulator [Clostridiaceae bacterium]
MKISTKGRYALRIMMDLANNENDEFISLKDISKRINISIKYLEQIVALLNKAGYVQTARGNNGGYKLAKKPEEYKVGDILRATEGDLAPIYCVSTDGTCDKKDNCSTYFFWEGLDKAINDYVDSKTLADLVK